MAALFGFIAVHHRFLHLSLSSKHSARNRLSRPSNSYASRIVDSLSNWDNRNTYMARFLDTHTGEFRWINDPSTVTYAILSHRWDEKGEQTFPEVEELRKELSGTDSLLAHPKLSAKIKGICKVAREAGYQLIWIDSCCIDKTKSAELAEALNSMFELYRLAAVCYVYLVDVPPGMEPSAKSSFFRKSEWHTRGWTLQEVIAPKDVVFLAGDWTFLGTKMTLASTLEEISGIDAEILVGTADLDSVSVSRKMSWAASRRTTRVEDEAYSLLGIFKVYLSPIYGEGRNAFIRLQEEILRTIPDQSLFAWGAYCTLSSLNEVTAASKDNDTADPGLLAQTPSAFATARGIRILSSAQFFSILGSSQTSARQRSPPSPPPIHSVVTPQGVRMQLMCIDLPLEVVHGLLRHGLGYRRRRSSIGATCCIGMGRATRLALLRCIDEDGYLIAIALYQPEPAELSELKGTPIATHKKCRANCRSHTPFRVVRLARDAWTALRGSQRLVEVTLLRHGALWSPSPSVPNRNVFVNLWPSTWNDYTSAYPLATIYLAPECEQLLRSLGCTFSPFVFRRSRDQKSLSVITTLCVPDVHTTAEGSSIERALCSSRCKESSHNISQHIGIRLSLNSEPMSMNFESGGTKVVFAIENFVHARVTRSSSKGAAIGPATCDFCHPTHPQKLPDYPNMEERREMYFDLVTGKRTITQDDIMIPVDIPQVSSGPAYDNPHRGVFVRVLRLSLQFRDDVLSAEPLLRGHADGRGEGVLIASKLWLTVDLSQRYLRHSSVPDTGELPRATIVNPDIDDFEGGNSSDDDVVGVRPSVYTHDHVTGMKGKDPSTLSRYSRGDHDPSSSDIDVSEPESSSARRSKARSPSSGSSESSSEDMRSNAHQQTRNHQSKKQNYLRNVRGRRFNR
ncbi:hypothetical protein BC628DRAFT_478124 [Trametes gibbosa]|nr:hypothetical protein BC628DRAFT_478124 [Trametes gibbosa]